MGNFFINNDQRIQTPENFKPRKLTWQYIKKFFIGIKSRPRLFHFPTKNSNLQSTYNYENRDQSEGVFVFSHELIKSGRKSLFL